MIAALLFSFAAMPQDDVFFVDASLELDGRLLSWETVHGLPDGEVDLVLAVERNGVRELRVHAVLADRVDPKPRRLVPMLDDIVAWGATELRDEPGKELLLVTPGGAYSYSLTRDGYRDNARQLARAELIYDVPDPEALPRWRYVLPNFAANGRAAVLLPERDVLALWTPKDGEPALYERTASYARMPVARDGVEVSIGGDDSGVREGSGDSGPFLLSEGGTLLADAHAYRAPALVDVDGDGRLDLVDLVLDQLEVRLDAAAEPTRVESFPAYLRQGEEDLDFAFHDLDGDGKQDLIVRARGEGGGVRNTTIRLLLLVNDGTRLLPPEPTQVLRFDAASVRFAVRDIDGDGRPDLIVRTFSLPSMLQAVTGPEFTLTHLVYFGERGGFARQPALRHVETFDESGASAAIANYEWELDCDGDGIVDLCAVDLSGKISVRRLRKQSSFLRGTRWELDTTPWRTFDARGSIGSLVVRDLNGDGLGDLVSAGPERLTIYLSRRRGGGK